MVIIHLTKLDLSIIVKYLLDLVSNEIYILKQFVFVS